MPAPLYAACRDGFFHANKRLLDWVTAAQADAKKTGLFAYYRLMWILPLSGGILALLGPWISKVLGICWIFTPYALYRIGKESKKEANHLSKLEKKRLMGYAKDMRLFFKDFVNEENSFLPPDNYHAAIL